MLSLAPPHCWRKKRPAENMTIPLTDPFTDQGAQTLTGLSERLHRITWICGNFDGSRMWSPFSEGGTAIESESGESAAQAGSVQPTAKTSSARASPFMLVLWIGDRATPVRTYFGKKVTVNGSETSFPTHTPLDAAFGSVSKTACIFTVGKWPAILGHTFHLEFSV